MELLQTLGLAMGASWVSGINLYAAVMTLGLLGRFAHLRLPGELDALTSWWIIGIAGVMYGVEFIADKVPVVDSAWDAVHTFIRVPAGAVLAAAAFGDFDPVVKAAAMLVGGTLALSSHGTKATARAAINTSPEPFSNVGMSLLEDAVAFGSILIAVAYPAVIIVVVILAVVVSFIILPKILRFLRRVFSRLRGLFGASA